MLSRIFESAERGRPGEPGGRQEAGHQQRAAADLEPALGADHVADVVGVALAEVGEGALADRVELGAERFDLLGGELGLGVHWVSLLVGLG